jgi:predicted transcriptional regulator
MQVVRLINTPGTHPARLKKKQSRPRVLALMEILLALRDGPMLPNRISQVCNLNYQRAIEMLENLEKMGFIGHTVQDGHELYHLTAEGLEQSKKYQWVHSMVMGNAPAPEEMKRKRKTTENSPSSG